MFENEKIKFLLRCVFLFFCVEKSLFSSDFSGVWCWEKSDKKRTFSLKIVSGSNVYNGGYVAIAEGGDIIDDNDESFSFPTGEVNVVKTRVQAGRSGNFGLVQIEMKNNKLQWEVLKEPEGEYFFPDKAVLYKCK